MEQEDKWINYEEEETEVNVELSDLVFNDLLIEVARDLLIK